MSNIRFKDITYEQAERLLKIAQSDKFTPVGIWYDWATGRHNALFNSEENLEDSLESWELYLNIRKV